jgi:hypothetical protein
VHKSPGLMLWEGKTVGKKGKKRGIPRYVETAGGHVGHVVFFAGNGANGERAGLHGPLKCR